jgi:hypothetical protein
MTEFTDWAALKHRTWWEAGIPTVVHVARWLLPSLAMDQP